MKILLAVLTLTTQILILTNVHTLGYSENEIVEKYEYKLNEENKSVIDEFILDFIFPHIDDAVKDFYKDSFKNKNYYGGEILELKKENGSYRLIISIQTFTGPHNPPYGLETITFNIDFNKKNYIENGSKSFVEVVEYKHKDLKKMILDK